jgi:hypothetical protein
VSHRQQFVGLGSSTIIQHRKHLTTDILDSRYLKAIDLVRHKADSRASYEQYFTILRQKMDQYNIQSHNCYNIDEKGFLISYLQKVRRIFPKALM